jgi:hypothetical protein
MQGTILHGLNLALCFGNKWEHSLPRWLWNWAIGSHVERPKHSQMPYKTTSTDTSNTASGMLLPWFYCWPLYNMCTGIKSPTSVDIDEQVVNNVVASFVDNLFIVGSTTLFTPVNITILSFFTCVLLCFLLQIQKPSHFQDYLDSWVYDCIFFIFFYIQYIIQDVDGKLYIRLMYWI